jgi:hypothetical protein
LKTNTNETVIGYSGRGNGSNTTTLGNSSTVGTYIPAGESYFGTTTDAGDFRVQVNGRHYIESPAYSNSSDLGLVINTSSGAGAGLNLRHATNGRFSIIQNYNATNTTSIVLGTSTNNPTTVGLFFQHSTGNIGFGGANANYPITITGGSTESFQQWVIPNRPTAAANGLLVGVQRIGSDTITAVIKNQENYPMIFYTNNTDRARFKADGEMLIGYTADQGAYLLQVNGNTLTNGSLTTSAPSGDAAKPWKFGTAGANGSSHTPTRSITVEIDGVIYYLQAVAASDL